MTKKSQMKPDFPKITKNKIMLSTHSFLMQSFRQPKERKIVLNTECCSQLSQSKKVLSTKNKNKCLGERKYQPRILA